MRLPIYMDYQATTPVDPRVVESMLPFFTENFGNPASRQHRFGWVTEEAVESARALIARSLGAEPREIIFTSGATESNNLALKGTGEALRQKGNHIVTVQTEHRSVLDPVRKLEKLGFQVTFLEVDEQGILDPDRLRAALTPKTILVSVMFANNEIGTIQDIRSIGTICRENGILFHTDATQAAGKLPIDVQESKVDLLSCSAHKIYGPKGIGALYVRSSNPRVKLAPQMDGGGHERGIRSGTLNVAGIVGFAKAMELSIHSMNEESKRLTVLRDKMLNAVRAQLDDICLNGHPTSRLPNNLNISFLGVEDNALMMSMKDVAVSTGSACSTADPEPSHVLKALRLRPERLHSAIRFSIGRFTTGEEVDYVVARVVESVNTLRKLMPPSRSSRTRVRDEATIGRGI
ncbi:MAG: IscS subfamily cysteine desulfurase [Ignavibacteria bacterium]|nr:MAG: IscS subfamily cysteine desulfurase [Ignavibacteria bacterium]